MKAIAAKMSQVGRAVGFGIPKDGRNQAQNYDYTSAASVRMSVGPQLAERGIAVSSHIEFVHREAFTNAKGNRQHHVIIRTTLNYVDSATGETMEVQGLGEGVDSGDKASAKAMTMAEKYCYVSAFTLAMGEDPEHDEAPKRDDRLGNEEHARAAKQADAKAAAKIEADALINTFLCIAGGDEASAWIRKNVAEWDVSEKSQRARVDRACLAHVKAGRVDGMTEAGFAEEMEHETRKQRGAV